MRSRHLSLAYRKQWFFWDVRESRADYGVPNRRVFLWRDLHSGRVMAPFSGCSKLGSHSFLPTRESQTPQYILKRIRWNYRVSYLSIEPGGASALSQTRKRRLWGEDTASQSFAIYEPQCGLSSRIHVFFQRHKIFPGTTLAICPVEQLAKLLFF